MNRFNKLVVGVAGAGMSLGAMAQAATGPDLSAITAAATTVGAVGAAVFAVFIGIKLFKWIRSAL